MKFGVFSDLHYDAVPDADERIEKLLQRFADAPVDFVIELGDLCHPTPQNQSIRSRFAKAGLDCRFSIGNHNTDFCSPETVLAFFGLKRGYYAIVHDNVKFLFLDANYVKTPTGILPECRASLAGESVEYPYIPPEQIRWLQQEIADDRYYYIICSHQSLSNDFMIGPYRRGIANRAEVRGVLQARNALEKRVLLCLNGNDHGDDVRVIDGIHYYALHSASYMWHGMKAMYAFSKSTHEQYLHLKDMILYKEPLSIVVTIDESMNIDIEGMETCYLNITPGDVGIGDTWNGVSILPRTSSVHIAL